ncbi:pentatricopeptide repeat-containing protein At5g66500, mitochondrial-like isoform X2 [Ananas comosus]|uniref:Pentatricopeptide repeat-containing protein At5g66500, mitochondrial-like isoform X2 n=1 Tax=Ananas comosus TaxID=4615 RepID=A0A6P5EZR4_ANACO|nr:pentatricopeptide repeat-containing protein At5g66500, mitochondrial-like isoform X2 [Ananas comosus]
MFSVRLMRRSSPATFLFSRRSSTPRTHHLFDETPQRRRFLDPFSLLPLLASSPSLSPLFHAPMLKSSALAHYPAPATALLASYSISGHLLSALSLFDEMPLRDTVAWNSLISCLVRHGRATDAVSAFRSMASDGVPFTGFTICSLLKALALSRALRRGRQIHSWVVVSGYDCVVMATALIDFYSSCGVVHDAIEVFERLDCVKDVVVCNSMISGFVQNRRFEEAFSMVGKVARPNGVTLTCAVSACSETLNLGYGKQTHCAAIRRGFDSDTILCNALVDMYAKCGAIEAANIVFNRIREKNVVSWTSIIDAYGSHGRGNEALELFERMRQGERSQNVLPNAVTFLAALSACGHSGLVDEGRKCFFLMSDKYRIEPGPEHYACLINLLGRAGMIDEAWDIYHSLSAETADKLSNAVCVAMLNACGVCMDFVRGEQVAKKLLEIDRENPGSYVLVSNFYAAVGRWGGADDLRRMMHDRGLKKESASSQVAVEIAVDQEKNKFVSSNNRTLNKFTFKSCDYEHLQSGNSV